MEIPASASPQIQLRLACLSAAQEHLWEVNARSKGKDEPSTPWTIEDEIENARKIEEYVTNG